MRMLVLAVCVTGGYFLLGSSSCSNTGGSPAGHKHQGSSGPVAMGVQMRDSSNHKATVVGFSGNQPAAQYSSIPAGKECVKVKLALANGDSSEWTLPVYEFGVVDGSGQKYDPDNGVMDCQGGSSSIDSIVAGGHASATLVFEVPSNSKLNLSWVPNSFESENYQTKLR